MKDMIITSLFLTTYTFQTHKYPDEVPRADSLQNSKVTQCSHNSIPKVPKILSQIVKAIIWCSPSLDFLFDVRISMIGHFYRPKSKKFTFSSLNFKHPIKVIFRYLTWNMSFRRKNRLKKKVKKEQASPFELFFASPNSLKKKKKWFGNCTKLPWHPQIPKLLM